MKTLLLFFCLFISIKSFNQKVTYKDLIGTSWISDKLPLTDSCLYTFLDSTHYRYYYTSTFPKRNNAWIFPDGMIFNYSLDTNYSNTLWHLQAYKEGKVKLVALDRFIEFVDNNTLKVRAKKDKYYALLKKVK